MIQVAHLFSPRHTARAAQVFKAHPWTQLEYAAFLERVAAYRAPGRGGTAPNMPPDTLKALFTVIPRVSNPLVRRACLDHLQTLGSADTRAACCASFLSTGSYEQACTYIDPASDTCNEIVAAGGANEVYAAVRTGRMPGPLWSRLFAAFVAADDYGAARELWLRADRPAAKAAGEDTVQKLVELIGRHKDRTMLRQFLTASGENGELALKSGAVAACLNCFADDPQLVKIVQQNEALLARVLVLQDGRFVSDALSHRIVELLDSSRNAKSPMSTFLGNLLLQGVYRQNSSRTVLHVYRLLAAEFGFAPNSDTARVLVNAAYRLGNSKLLSYEIWKEMVGRGVALHRGFYETVLVCQLVGSQYRSALFFVSEMRREQVPLRAHIQRLLFNKFERIGDSASLVELFQQRRPESANVHFDVAAAEAECESLSQARANADVFARGQNPDSDAQAELARMLAFDARKARNAHKTRSAREVHNTYEAHNTHNAQKAERSSGDVRGDVREDAARKSAT